jgi:heavy metal translocating P-type ATPase
MSDGPMVAGPGVKVVSNIGVSFPEAGVIRVESERLFSALDGALCRRFLQAALRLRAIEDATFAPTQTPSVDLRYDESRHRRKTVLNELAVVLGRSAGEGKRMTVAPSAAARDRHGVVRYRHYAGHITGWSVERERVGAIRLHNPLLHRKRALCDALERELMSTLGVTRYDTDAVKCRVDIEYDPQRISAAQLVEILDAALVTAEHPAQLDRIDRELTICTASLPLAAAAQFAVPALIPVSAVLFAYTALPSFQGAWRVVTKERRLGVDVLDSIVVLACLGTGQILAGAVLCWCLSFGRFLVRRTEDRSKKMLLGAFGKQPRFVWLLVDGQEIQVPLNKLNKGDIVVVNTGEVVPVDGVIVDGLAMIDQHALTGESTPAEKGVGDEVFASTVMVAGKIHISVEKSGEATATSKIAQILNDTAGYKLASQQRGERLADTAVVPTLAVGALAFGAIGAQGAAAVLNSDMGTGIRMAAPLAMLSTLALCSQRGVLVKDGRALDLLSEIDTVLFDKTGTLTRERPEVGRIIAANGHLPEDILRYAAAAESRFHHPIALAILQKAQEELLDVPPIDQAQYKVGHGIIVTVEGRRVRVGSRRFMELEGVALTPEVMAALDEAHREGLSMVMVAVDDALGGALELRASVRPEVPEIIRGLRARGIEHIAVISGDHEAPTRKLAADLGIDRYFAQVLPTEKADYVEKLQKEGRKVCFVGDGINDAIALKKANVSISLRGASSIATDTAHVVFMEPGLGKLCELRDIAGDLQRNVRISWGLILVPNILCIVGVFTLGFGIAASVLTNNVAALGALVNGVRPMRKVAAYEAERRHLLELQLHQGGFLDAAQVSADEAEGTRSLADREGDRRFTVRRVGERRRRSAAL